MILSYATAIGIYDGNDYLDDYFIHTQCHQHGAQVRSLTVALNDVVDCVFAFDKSILPISHSIVYLECNCEDQLLAELLV